MDYDNGGGIQFKGALDDFAGINRRVIDGAGLLHLVGDQDIFLVEEEDAELTTAGKLSLGVNELGMASLKRPLGVP